MLQTKIKHLLTKALEASLLDNVPIWGATFCST